MDKDNVYTLKTSIEFGEDHITEINLIEPTGAQLAGVKISIPLGDNPEMEIDYMKAQKVIAACCTLAPPLLKKMKASDISSCYLQCVELFCQE